MWQNPQFSNVFWQVLALLKQSDSPHPNISTTDAAKMVMWKISAKIILQYKKIYNI